ncbi:MAG: LysR family transcriptional regulator [Pseudomonadota bacterium]
MELNDLKILLSVARLGSFAAAARESDVDPSLVSRTVARLEEHFKVRIFQRTTRRLSLTEAGRHVLGRMQDIVDELESVRDEAQLLEAKISGTLRLTTSTAFGQVCIVPLLTDLREAHPDLKLELILSDENVDLVRDGVDLAIRLAPEVQGDFICAKLCGTSYRVCASPGYMRSAPPARKPQDLRQHEALLFDLPAYRTRWQFRDRRGRVVDVPVQGRFATTNAVALRDAARAGLGVALLADWLVADDLAQGRLVDAFPKHQVTATRFDTAAWIVYPSRRFVPARVRTMIDFLRQHIGSNTNT